MEQGTDLTAWSVAVTVSVWTTASATSADGTTIGYRRIARGPGVVLLHGAASSGYNHRQLAEALADTFTVYVPDRRGRGLSGPYRQEHRLRDDVDDLAALLTATDTHAIFGVSSGGIIALQAALDLPAIRTLAIFEPPLFIDNTATPTAILDRFDRELAQGQVAAAMVTAMQGAQMGPPIFNHLPRWLLARLVGMAMRGEAKKGSGDYIPMRQIAPTLPYYFQLVVEMAGPVGRFGAIDADVLLLGGSKSPAYLNAALDALARALPDAARIELPGADHAASWNTDRGGKPEPVARALRRFFGAE